MTGTNFKIWSIKEVWLQVFGKWVVCKDSDTASKVIAQSSQVNCVTIHGDVHAKKGTITGGYRNEKWFVTDP